MTACAHTGCSCDVEVPKAFVQYGETYCSSGCAAGEGCEHTDCSCSTQQPEGERNKPDRSKRSTTTL